MDDINEEQMAADRERLADRLQLFGATLAKMRDEWVSSRQNRGWDKRVAQDIDQYNGIDGANKHTESMMQTVERGYPNTAGDSSRPTRSTVFIGMTRQKTNAAEARLADILFPTDERNWGIKPTPDPELAKMSEDDTPMVAPDGASVDPVTGEPVRARDIALVDMEKAKEASEAMTKEIDDQLVECDYIGEGRRIIHDAAVKGTGVLKGPIVTNRQRKSWNRITDGNETVYAVSMQSETRPASFRVDPRNVFEDPACGEDIQNGRGIFERDLKTTKQLRELAKQPGYLEDQIRAVLEEGPVASQASREIGDEQKREQTMSNFEVWEYWGEIEMEDAKAAGLDVDDSDPLQALSACVVMVNTTVIKVFPNPMETGELPYDFFAWEREPDSPRGYGVPFLMRSQQKVMNAAWRTMMDNAGTSSGPQIVLKPSVIQPADKKWELTSRKLWYCTDPTQDVRQAFTTFEFNSHQSELAGIIEMATRLADEETAVPVLAQGQERNVPDTVGGIQMLMQSANVVLRRLVKQYDDWITKPHLRRYYDYNMLYSDKDEIKGDFEVDARGSSTMVVRDVRNQALLQLLGAAANPAFQPLIDVKKLFEKALQAQHIDPRDVMKSDEEIEADAQAAAQQQPQQDPQLQVAQIRADAAVKQTEITQQSDQRELEIRQQIADATLSAKMQQLMLEREIEMLKLAQTKELTLEEIKAKLADTAMREQSRQTLFNSEAQLKLRTGQGI